MKLKNDKSIWAKLKELEIVLAVGNKVIEEVEKEVEKEKNQKQGKEDKGE